MIMGLPTTNLDKYAGSSWPHKTKPKLGRDDHWLIDFTSYSTWVNSWAAWRTQAIYALVWFASLDSLIISDVRDVGAVVREVQHRCGKSRLNLSYRLLIESLWTNTPFI